MKSTNFQTYRDSLAQSGYRQSAAIAAIINNHKTVEVETRNLTYQFSPHFHPYVTDLIDRLIEKSIPGLQAADTEYRTLAKLSAEITVVSIDANDKQSTQTIPKDTIISLADGTIVTRSDLSTLQLSGNKVLKLDQTLNVDSSTPLALSKDAPISIPQNTSARIVSIPDNPQAALIFDRSITISSNAAATLIYGKPTPVLYEEFFSKYEPDKDLVPNTPASPHPVKDLDFTSGGAYSVYNWELFFHVPMTIAVHLSKNQRFEEAMQWFHYIFDPTDNGDGPTPERFWKVKPFQYTDVKLVEDILINLSSNVDETLNKETINSINAWKDNPFRPHVIARYRQSAYMFKTIMAYLDNLIAWGDSLFRQDTGESINEAAQLYILAANILGPKPQAVPKKSSVRPQTYASLRDSLDAFGNAQREAEIKIPFASISLPTTASEIDQTVNLRSLGKDLYFCVPHNEKLLSYWDTVGDRLFKIRNSLNLQGIFRQLPLFEPPIDPALLAKAAASGLDVGAVINGLNQPLPLVRFQVLVQKASEICQEVKSLGNNLLSAIEKEDNESLAILRAQHERIILNLAETVKYSQWQEAIKAREGSETSLANAVQRYIYYERQLGKKDPEIKIPHIESLEVESLEKFKFKSGEPEIGLRSIDVDIDRGFLGDVSGILAGGKILSSHEVREMLLLETSQLTKDVAAVFSAGSSVAHIVPNFGAHAQPTGPGASVTMGGENIGQSLDALSKGAHALADRLSFEANRAAKIGSYDRREQEWAFQSNTIAGEITQIFKQLRASQIREAIAEREWKNHQVQIRHAEEIERFLTDEKTGKRSNKDFYTWMKREVKGLYGQVFQFAFDVAKKAERALQHELGKPDISFLQFGYLAGKEGLLAGEKLYLDIKRMEMAYHDLNQREYELTKHVSLLQVSPIELLKLRTTGRCTVTLPEELFDLDCPGHYFRRIKNVALSIPCVSGPYTSVNCTLTLTKSSIRKSALLVGDEYPRVDTEDNRFDDHFGSLQSIVTSSGQNDGGLFETNLRDERYLPFEGSGVISEWQLQLPANPSQNEACQFDYNTISDAIIHIRYTAREAGGLLRKKAIENIATATQSIGSVRLLSIRHEFPTEWAKFKNPQIVEGTTAELILPLREEHYPFWSKGNVKKIERAELFIETNTTITVKYQAGAGGDTDTLSTSLGNLRSGNLTNLPKTIKPISTIIENEKFKLYFADRSMEDMWLAITWS
jgi:Tc toxin complex TcA C-terminal TcB-binding domain